MKKIHILDDHILLSNGLNKFYFTFFDGYSVSESS